MLVAVGTDGCPGCRVPGAGLIVAPKRGILKFISPALVDRTIIDTPLGGGTESRRYRAFVRSVLKTDTWPVRVKGELPLKLKNACLKTSMCAKIHCSYS